MVSDLAPLLMGEKVQVIAPASRCSDNDLIDITNLLSSWGLAVYVNPEIFGEDLLCANQDEIRFKQLVEAIENPDIKAIFCVRGGYGSMRLLPLLLNHSRPAYKKWFIGMSDVTALHLFLNQFWHWPTVLAGINPNLFSSASLSALKSILFSKDDLISLSYEPLNHYAQQCLALEGELIGGNLSLVQCSLATSWQIKAMNKIILLEEINERGYQIDRMLQHLAQSEVFNGARALILGDFLKGDEPNGCSLVEPVLRRFATACKIPVFKIQQIGHGYENYPCLLGRSIAITFNKQLNLAHLVYKP